MYKTESVAILDDRHECYANFVVGEMTFDGGVGGTTSKVSRIFVGRHAVLIQFESKRVRAFGNVPYEAYGIEEE